MHSICTRDPWIISPTVLQNPGTLNKEWDIAHLQDLYQNFSANGLEGLPTSHSLRATSITRMFKADIPERSQLKSQDTKI